MVGQIPDEVVQAVREASARAEIEHAVRAIYDDIEQRVAQLGPRCEMSGRCCRFESYGHRLFVTTVELAVFVRQFVNLPQLAPLLVNADGEGCRFQVNRQCIAHAIRPMGCRLFFCDPHHEQPLQALYEQMHARLKQVHETLGVPYFYLEWRQGVSAIEPLLRR